MTTTYADDEEYNPTSPSIKPRNEVPLKQRAPLSPHYDPKSPIPEQHRRTQSQVDDEYDPAEPEIRVADDAPIIKNGFRISGKAEKQTTFAFIGDPYQPRNLTDFARPIIYKRLRCNICPDPINFETFVPAFLLRRPNEPPIPKDRAERDRPWFWTQAFCFLCSYTFTVKIYLPDDFYECCTLARYPPKKGTSKYTNGMLSDGVAMDDNPNEMYRQRKREQRTRSPRRQDRSPPRRTPPRTRSPRRRSPVRRDRSPPRDRNRYSRSRSRSPRRRSPRRNYNGGYGYQQPTQYPQSAYVQTGYPPATYSVIPPPQQYHEYIPAPSNVSVPPVKSEQAYEYGAYNAK